MWYLTWFRPSSMRLAISISPWRVSSSTVPISRMYMRTGSVVRPNSASTLASAASASSAASSSFDTAASDSSHRLGVRRFFVHRDTHVIDHVDDVFDLLWIDDVVGQVVVDLGIGQVALFLAAGNQIFELLSLLARGNYCCTFFSQDGNPCR